mmetsp:Transcript_9032/g.27709  ORF Transcript_9032/g.27709 Transcript_9032/m.27709 type:complete len:232 (+) Transcript_9032:3-698(+)
MINLASMSGFVVVPTSPTPGTSREAYEADGPVARRIAQVVPFYPFKQIPRFYDIGGFLKDPEAFALVVEVLVRRYADTDVTAIGGIDARGFVLGPVIALALKKPFFMLRKKGKMPNSITGKQYAKEYAGDDALSIPRGAVGPSDKVVLIDDLVATGGTLVAAIDLVKALGATVLECACVVDIKFLDAKAKFAAHNHADVPIWALMSEDILQLDGLADPAVKANYVDDGEAH